ncbi:MAG: beta strand repeat-containing protein, partial [Erythrobacter sp.]
MDEGGTCGGTCGGEEGEGGDGEGGEATVTALGASAAGSLVVTGSTSIFANGEGAGFSGDPSGPITLRGNAPLSFQGGLGLPGGFGPTPRAGMANGTGRGGLAAVDVLNGTTVTFATAQIAAIGQGGAASAQGGGHGFGGTARLQASGAGSRIAIQRNLTVEGTKGSLAGKALLSADGIGTDATGGSGLGGNGTGGTVSLIARGGGGIALPTTPLSDPDSVGVLAMWARGRAGGSGVEGGVGGVGVGGIATIEVDGTGSSIVMGDAEFTVASVGGASLDSVRNVTGGADQGGRRSISVLNGGALTLGTFTGGSGATGGAGIGTGNGGNATSGITSVLLDGGTLNLTGILELADVAQAGSGARGGDAILGTDSAVSFSATGSTIALSADALGRKGIVLKADARGGGGGTGGDATAAPVRFTLRETNLVGASLQIQSLATGGTPTASDSAIGGKATAGAVEVILRNATLGLLGETVIASTAIGGDGGLASGTGGEATAGVVEVQMTGGALTVEAAGNSAGTLTLRSAADAGRGFTMGQATSAQAGLALGGARLTADAVQIESRALALFGTNGSALSGASLFDIAGASVVVAPLVTLRSDARSVGAGSVEAGAVTLRTAAGSTARLDATTITLAAEATNSSPAASPASSMVSGQAFVDIRGGNVNTTDLTIGVPLAFGTARNSGIAAVGGSLNVTGTLSVQVPGNLDLRTGQGGLIGSLAASGNSTAVQVDAKGTITTIGDGGAGSGIAARTITLQAGRSLLLGGTLTTRSSGAVNLTANLGGGQPLAQPAPSVITMTQGARIDAGGGTVTLRLRDGAGDPQRANGAITLASITAGRIDARNFGTSQGSDIRVLADGVLTASGTGRAIDLASLNGEVVNLAGDAGLVLTGGGHYGIFAATPAGSQIGSFANYARRYNVANAEAYDQLNPGGNFAAFRIVPVLTVTANDVSRFYGSANPAFTATFSGFQPGDGVADLLGAPQFTTAATSASSIGQFAIGTALGSLVSQQGYQFVFAPGTLTITPRPITVTADNLSRIYGNANPALTFTVGGLGLVN